jgi:GNAT superfamily N-acetyltransferase
MKVEFIEGLPFEKAKVFEDEHSSDIRLSILDKQELKNMGAVFFYLRDKNTKDLIAETYYIEVDNLEKLSKHLQVPGIEAKWIGKNGIYCYSNTTLSPFKKQGFGKQLKKYFLNQAKEKGYEFVIGHARRNGGIELNLSLGAEKLHECPNWSNGETYEFYYQKL